MFSNPSEAEKEVEELWNGLYDMYHNDNMDLVVELKNVKHELEHALRSKDWEGDYGVDIDNVDWPLVNKSPDDEIPIERMKRDVDIQQISEEL